MFFSFLVVICFFFAIVCIGGMFYEMSLDNGAPMCPMILGIMFFFLGCLLKDIERREELEKETSRHETVLNIEYIKRDNGVTYVYGQGVCASNNTALVYIAETNRLVLVKTDMKNTKNTILSSKIDIVVK